MEFLTVSDIQNVRILSKNHLKLNLKNIFKEKVFDYDFYMVKCETPDLSYVSKITIDDSFDQLSQKFHLFKNIETLVIFNSKLKDQTLKELLNESNIANLSLYKCTNITNEGLKYCKDLKYLRIIENRKINDDGMRYLENLKFIALNGLSITEKCFHYFKNVENFMIYNLIIKNEQCFESFGNLKKLVLFSINIKDENFKYLKNLEELSLDYCLNLNGSGFKFLVNLEALVLRNTYIQDVDYFKYMKKLTKLELINSNLNDNLCKFITKVKEIKILEVGITDEGISYLENIESINYQSYSYSLNGECFKNLKKLKNLSISQHDLNSTFCFNLKEYLVDQLKKIEIDCEDYDLERLKFFKGIPKIFLKFHKEINYQNLIEFYGDESRLTIV